MSAHINRMQELIPPIIKELTEQLDTLSTLEITALDGIVDGFRQQLQAAASAESSVEELNSMFNTLTAQIDSLKQLVEDDERRVNDLFRKAESKIVIALESVEEHQDSIQVHNETQDSQLQRITENLELLHENLNNTDALSDQLQQLVQ